MREGRRQLSVALEQLFHREQEVELQSLFYFLGGGGRTLLD